LGVIAVIQAGELAVDVAGTWGVRNACNVQSENLKERDHLKILGVEWRNGL